jgi:aminoglycoside phosphotransferase (APT) family kinase protein
LAEQILRRQGFSGASVDKLRLVHRGACNVYRARAGSHELVLHTGGEVLVRQLHDNLVTLEQIDGDGLPRAIGWEAPEAGRAHGPAVLVSTLLAGVELSTRTFSPEAWNELCRILLRLHRLPADGEPGARRRPVHDASSFPELAAELEEAVRKHRLPIPLDRLRRHLESMAEHTQVHAAAFNVRPALIHTDLSRANVLIDGPKAGIVDWLDLGEGDYAFDLASLKFAMDSVRPSDSATLLQEQARLYRAVFDDSTLELRMRFFMALVGLVRAHSYAGHTRPYPPGRAWRVRTCYLHSEAQWRSPLRLDGDDVGAPAVPTDHRPLPPSRPLRALYYLASNRRAM